MSVQCSALLLNFLNISANEIRWRAARCCLGFSIEQIRTVAYCVNKNFHYSNQIVLQSTPSRAYILRQDMKDMHDMRRILIIQSLLLALHICITGSLEARPFAALETK
jgi:hypothetical protein